jgi:hypothetical protein
MSEVHHPMAHPRSIGALVVELLMKRCEDAIPGINVALGQAAP